MRDLIGRKASGLSTVATFLEWYAIINAIAGVIVGIVLVAHTEGEYSFDRTHPWVAAGVSLMVGSVVFGLLFWALARAFNLFALHVAASQGMTLNDWTALKEGRVLDRPPSEQPTDLGTASRGTVDVGDFITIEVVGDVLGLPGDENRATVRRMMSRRDAPGPVVKANLSGRPAQWSRKEIEAWGAALPEE